MHALNRLILYYNSGSPGDVYYSVAEILLHNINTLFDKTIYDWAELCYVSTSTISRFSQKMGYKNFNEFKVELATAVENYHILNQYSPINRIGEYQSEESAYLSMLQNNIDIFCRTINLGKIEEIADLIYKHEVIHIYPHGVSLTESSLQSNLIMSGRQAKSILFPTAQLKDVETLPEASLVLLTAPNVHERTMFLDILKALKERGITTVVLTNSRHTVFLKYADCAYCFDGNMTQLDDFHFSMVFSLLSITYRRKYMQGP